MDRSIFSKIFSEMMKNLIVFVFTYAITLLCIFMFKSDDYASAIVDTIATTTITYSLSIIIGNLFIKHNHTMYFTIVSIGIAIVYVIIYVACCNYVFPIQAFWTFTFVTIAFSLISEIEKLFHECKAIKRTKYFKVFSA